MLAGRSRRAASTRWRTLSAARSASTPSRKVTTIDAPPARDVDVISSTSARPLIWSSTTLVTCSSTSIEPAPG
jgi:hypothetical protein